MTKPKRYRVAGAHPVLGHQPGDAVDVTGVPSDQLARLLARGSLEVEAVREAGKKGDED